MLFRTFIFTSLLVPVALAEPATRGAEQRGTLTLREALALTLRQNPDLAIFSWDIRAADARIVQAALRPNPELSLEAQNLTGSGDFRSGDEAERTVQLSQVVELGRKRPARIHAAQAGRVLSEWDYEAKRIGVLKTTTQAFIDVLAAQRRVTLAGETAALAEKVVPLTQRRLEIGKASAVEVTRSNIAVASARIELEQARRELATARGNLAAQWGARSAAFEDAVGQLDRIPPVQPLALLTAKLFRNPQLARWASERDKREATLRLAQAQAIPDITVAAGPRMFGKGEDVTLGVVGVSIPLPLFNRNQGNIAEARANISKAEDERRAVEARAFAELNAAYQTLARTASEAATLRDSVLPGAQDAVEQTIAGYDTGRFSQLEILDARRTLFTARAQHLQALRDYHKALAEIEALTAGPATTPRLRIGPVRMRRTDK